MKYLTIFAAIFVSLGALALAFLGILAAMLSTSPANDLNAAVLMGLALVVLAILAGALILRR